MARLKLIARADQISMIKDSGTDEKRRAKKRARARFAAAPSPENVATARYVGCQIPVPKTWKELATQPWAA